MCRFTHAESADMCEPTPCTGESVAPMEWNYKREKKASAADIADVIHDSVTIEDALRVYCPGIEVKHHRCPCPIHNGRDYNFSFTDNGFKCFVCNASGDVISLVKEVCELSTRVEAMQKICEDFRLPVDFHAGLTHEVSAKVNQIREEAERKRRVKEEWEARYQNTLNEWIELDKVVLNTPWDSEENIRKICEAKEKKARVGYELDIILASEPR